MNNQNPISSSHIQNPIFKWLRDNLFNTWYNSLLTILCLWGLFVGLRGFLGWMLTQADWTVIDKNWRLFWVGRYPVTQLWRIWILLAIIVAVAALSWINSKIVNQTLKQRIYYFCLLPCYIGLLPISWWLIGGGFGLRSVPTNLWNALLLTLLMSAVSIMLSFPLGVLLAIGRQSSLPVLRWGCIFYIEVIRGLPLIGILFIAQVMLPLLLPGEIRLDRIVRAIAGLTLFSAAYMAENVRGGLQAVPRGQIEAARSLGLNTPLALLLIVLPQALRAVIPAIVGQFIGLFKDTSLLSLFALVELTGISRSILAQPQFLGRYGEVYLFVGFIYWIFCYSMSVASRKLETKLGVGNR
jgi:general L-amino acid transport system permease protein